MNASPKVLDVLKQIREKECDRSSLARWLAQESMAILESPNEVDRMIVNDLDVALGEIQRGTRGEGFLPDTAARLARDLRLSLPGWDIIEDRAAFRVEMNMSSTNQGDAIMDAQVEPVPSPA